MWSSLTKGSSSAGGSSHHRSGKTRMISSSSDPDADVTHAIPIVMGKLYFMISKFKPKSTDTSHFFSIDTLLRYEPFFVDFGPLNLASLYKFVRLVNDKLQKPKLAKSKIYYYCGKDPQRIANACYLIGAYLVLECGMHPAAAYRRIREFARRALPFRDASMGICSYRCTVEHCLWALHRAKGFHFLDLSLFDAVEYEHFERVEYGDLNIIVAGKFLAFAGPHRKAIDDEGYPALTPDVYLPIWKRFHVSCIIRLNRVCYDAEAWTRHGYKHHDLYFIDGTTPPQRIIEDFLKICEDNDVRYRNYALRAIQRRLDKMQRRARRKIAHDSSASSSSSRRSAHGSSDFAMQNDEDMHAHVRGRHDHDHVHGHGDAEEEEEEEEEEGDYFWRSGAGVVAVHCKAGLGRTGSLIGCYMMKHYGWTAAEVIAWLRICRPGSVIGPQQFFLENQQTAMWKAGDDFRRKFGLPIGGRRVFGQKQRLQYPHAKEALKHFTAKKEVTFSPTPASSHSSGRSGRHRSSSERVYGVGDVSHCGHIVCADPRTDTKEAWKKQQRKRKEEEKKRKAAAAAKAATASDSRAAMSTASLSSASMASASGSQLEAERSITAASVMGLSGDGSPLPTDPGQKQGSALRGAKLSRSPMHFAGGRTADVKKGRDRDRDKDVSMEPRTTARH